MHRVDTKVPIEDIASCVGDLIKEGKVKHWGYYKQLLQLFVKLILLP